MKNKKQPITITKLFIYFVIVSLCFCVAAFMFICFKSNKYNTKVLADSAQITKPFVDWRNYRVIKLANGLEVTLISDVKSNRCGLSLGVGLGYLNEEDDFEGITHLLEHVVMEGRLKKEFENHLSLYFGSTNSFTDEEKMTFALDLDWQGFESALSLFSKIIDNPMFAVADSSKTNSTNIDAQSKLQELIIELDKEFEQTVSSDYWKEKQLIKSLAKKGHPYSKFSLGNKHTLSKREIPVIELQLRTIYDKYFTPGNMKLTLISNQDLDNIQIFAEKNFNELRLKSVLQGKNDAYYTIQDKLKDNPFSIDMLNKFVWHQKNSKKITLDFIFPIKDLIKYILTKPEEYFIYQMKYSGKDSLIYKLQMMGYAIKLDAAILGRYRTFSLFAISLELLDEGVSYIKDINKMVFDYINSIKQKAISKEVYAEIQTISESKFFFNDGIKLMHQSTSSNQSKVESFNNESTNDDLLDYLALITSNMFDYESKNIIISNYAHFEYNNSTISEFNSQISEDNGLIILGTKSQDGIEKVFLDSGLSFDLSLEAYYKTSYSYTPLKNMISSANSTSFGFREKNNFITKETNIVSCLGEPKVIDINDEAQLNKCKDELYTLKPSLVDQENRSKIFYKMDRSFYTPKVNVYCNLIPLDLRESMSAQSLVFYAHLDRQIKLVLSNFIDAGNLIELSFNENGIDLYASVYTDLSNEFLSNLLFIIFKVDVVAEEFSGLIKESVSKLRNESKSPFKKIESILINTVKKISWNLEKFEADVSNLKFDKITADFSTIRSKITVNWMFYGSYTTLMLSDIMSKLSDYLKPNSNDVKEFSFRQSKQQLDYSTSLKLHRKIKGRLIKAISSTESENIFSVYYQIGERTPDTYVQSELLEIVWGNIFFYNLNVIKKLGYYISAQSREIDNVMYIEIIVQSYQNVLTIAKEISTVLDLLKARLTSLSSEKLALSKNALYFLLSEKENSLKERSDKAWNEIYEGVYNFNFYKQSIKILENLSDTQLINFYSNSVLNSNNRLTIVVTKEKSENFLVSSSPQILVGDSFPINGLEDNYIEKSSYPVIKENLLSSQRKSKQPATEKQARKLK